MKSILVPIDYSACAHNAMEYAIALAKHTGASITLLHVYHVPVPAGEVPLMLVSPREVFDANSGRLKELENAVRTVVENKIQVSSLLRQGFAADEIGVVADEIKADLVIMGMRGNTSSVNILMGSVTIAVVRNARVPVLTIPEKARFTPVKNMLFAFDYKSEPSENVLTPLKKYAALFSANIQVMNIVQPYETPDVRTAIAGVRMEEMLTATPHQLFFKEGNDVAEELHDAATRQHSDWLVMVPHHRRFLDGLFHKSTTKHTAYHTEIPLLTIHE